MKVIIFLITLYIIWLFFGRQIRIWFAGFMARRTEDYIRKTAGLPPRPGSKEDRRRRRQEKKKTGSASNARAGAYNTSQNYGQKRHYDAGNNHTPLIPKEYAEDVEFVETISYSQTTIGVNDSDRKRTVYHESQVSDVEWEEIKIRKK